MPKVVDRHKSLYKKWIRQVANLFGILVHAPRDRLGVFRGEVGCYRAGLALFEFIDDLGRMQRHVDRVIFGDDAVRDQQLHDLRGVVLVELAALDLNGAGANCREGAGIDRTALLPCLSGTTIASTREYRRVPCGGMNGPASSI